MKQDDRKHPWLAVTLSILLPGLGQIYAGALVRGVAFMLSVIARYYGATWYLFSPYSGLGLFWLYFMLAGLINIGGWVDAFLSARKYNRLTGLPPVTGKKPWLAVFLSLIIPGLGHFYLSRFTYGIVVILLWLLLNIPAYCAAWTFPILPLYTVLVAVHAHLSTADSAAHRNCLKLFIIIALVSLTLQTGFVALYGGEFFLAFRTKAAYPFSPTW